MSDSEKPFAIENAKTGRAACKKCKEKCETGQLRIAKLVANYFSDSGMMKHWFHLDCLFKAFQTQKATTKKIDSVEDIEGFENLSDEDQDLVIKKLFDATGKRLDKNQVSTKTSLPGKFSSNFKEESKDNLLSTFIQVVEEVAAESSYKAKSELLKTFLIKGSNKKIFEGDIVLWIKLLLPGAVKRVYNLQSKQLVKIFARVFQTNQNDMLIDLEQGDVAETIKKYFELSKKVKSDKASFLTLQDVDQFLDDLTTLTKEDEQTEAFSKLCGKANSEDLKIIIRFIKHDLRINAGPRHILDALSSEAYAAFQNSRNLQEVVEKFAPNLYKKATDSGLKGASAASTSAKINGVQLMSPISPMLAEACKSVQKAIEKNAEGMFSEIKYDGERVQIHKCGTDFKFFSRNLKPVMDHKINPCKKFIPQAFPTGQDIILDSEIIMVNRETGELLPFGSLGVHKREQFADAEVCLFIFDCIYYNGEDLTKRPLKERKKILEANIKPIKNHVQLSEYQLIKTEKELASMTAKVLKAGLEGLVLKNVNGLYQPGKRGWLKVKKDYLCEGQMADTADLVVLGAWFGTGKKGGMLSIFLMGCFDSRGKMWKTVTKVHSGLDDREMEDLQDELKDLMERADPDVPPSWLHCKKALIPDFIAKNPNVMPVWEITGAEFSKSDAHTASGISIRFPRITRIRRDKSTKDATNLKELEKLFETSKDNINVDMLFKGISTTMGAGTGDISDSKKKNNDIMTKFLGGKVKRRSSVDDIESTSPSKRIKKELNESGSSGVENVKRENVFKGLLLYIKFDGKDMEQNDFIEMGGEITENKAVAEVVIHDTMTIEPNDLENYRKLYSKHCRHVGFKWLQDSLESKKIMPFGFYAVEIC